MTQPVRILLVDDEPNILKMVGKRLEVEGYEVLTAMDGQEALKLAQTQAPALIILDVMLPKLDGYEVCTMLKHDTRSQHIPVVMFSAKAQDKDEKLGLSCGADAYITKPFKAQDLLATIQTLVSRPDHVGEAADERG